MRTALAFLLLTAMLPSSVIADDEWNQFRGPRGDGISKAERLPVEWKEGADNIRWKTPIHGKGWSSPVLDGQKIWLTTATEDGTELSVLCVDAESGRILIDEVLFKVADPRYCHPTNSYASCTPVVYDGHVFVHFGRYGTACLESASGKVLWRQQDLECDDFRGPASSPVIHGDLLFLNFDGIDVQFVAALNRRTGQVVWKRTRDIDYGTDNGDRKKAYGTPQIIEHDGRVELVSPSAVETISYAPETGETLWRVRHGGMNAAARPLFGNGLLYISAGSGNTSLIAVRPGGSGDVTETHLAWSMGKSVPKRSSQILLGDRLFMVDDSGVASCLNALNGQIIWQKRLRGEFWSSPVFAGGLLYFTNKAGQTYVIRAADEFEQVSLNTLDAGSNASAAIVDESIILRTFTHLYRID